MSQKITQMVVENCDSQFLINQIKQTVIDEVNRIMSSSKNVGSQDKLFSRQQTAKYFDISMTTLHDWTNKGILQAHSIGGKVFYKQSSIESAIRPTKPYTCKKKK
ncbi:helix-turn-helix domain-containing protein [Fibrella sp. WM1]|uniref:helix-turn-helix domain-containing protein n=1 Tax=Fibrella musci TaxID=3242485 RepID=UPI0035204264